MHRFVQCIVQTSISCTTPRAPQTVPVSPHPSLPSPPAWGSLWSKFGPSRSLHTLIFIWKLWTRWWRAGAAMLTFILRALSPRNPASIWWTSLTGVSSDRAGRLHLTAPVPSVPPPVWVWRLWKILLHKYLIMINGVVFFKTLIKLAWS